MCALAQLKFGLIKRGDLVHELDAAERQVKDLLDRIKSQVSEAADRRQEAAETLKKYEAIQSERASAYDAAAAALRARGRDRPKCYKRSRLDRAEGARRRRKQDRRRGGKKSGTSRGRPRAKENSI